MKKYKNIIFDFGNVLALFNEQKVIGHYCNSSKDYSLMKNAVFYDWDSLDAGLIDYDVYMDHVKENLPVYLHPAILDFSKTWYQHLAPLTETWDLVHELKKRGYALYILSNASTYFAENSSFFEITKDFDGIVFSAPLKMAKPAPDIYQYLFRTFHLLPEECLFLDDRKENIQTGRELGMDGMVFDPSILPNLRHILL